MKSSELLPTYDNLRKTFVNDTIGRSADVIRFANLLNVIDSIGVINRRGSQFLGRPGRKAVD